MIIRFATPTDAPALRAIYAYYVTETAISFEYVVPSLDEFETRMRQIQEQLPYLVAEIDGQPLGYAYASRHHDRKAYQWSVDTSVYIHPDGHRKGIGRQLYTALFALLRRQGYYTAYAGITSPNPASEGLHQSFGFERVGTYSNVGYKLGKWHDVTWYQLTLQPYQLDPATPLPILHFT